MSSSVFGDGTTTATETTVVKKILPVGIVLIFGVRRAKKTEVYKIIQVTSQKLDAAYKKCQDVSQ